ncbi:hypothetical protein ACVIW0_000271 [Bradyrhizobium sp. USDA 4454]
MRRTLLINPFNLLAETPGQRADPGQRYTPVCDRCGSDDIVCHATIQWSNEAQDWQLTSTFGQPAHCNRCKSPCGLEWLAFS